MSSILKKMGASPLLIDRTGSILGPSALFQSAIFGVKGWKKVFVKVAADQPGALLIEFTPDFVNWDFSIDSVFGYLPGYAVPQVQVHESPIYAPYCRIKYTNGLVGQTWFRLEWYVTMF